MGNSVRARRNERTEPVSTEEVLDAAQRLIEEGGAAALSMRKLAGQLGVAVTAIYWHVGNREVLVTALVDRMIADMSAIAGSGRTPIERLVSIGRTLRRRLLERPHLVALVHEQGRTAVMFRPAQVALARELAEAGVTGERAAQALRAIEYQVIGFVVLERNIRRAPQQHPTSEELWRDQPAADVDPALAAHLAEPVDYDEVFDHSLRALVTSLVGARS